jgi:hypothetical protein
VVRNSVQIYALMICSLYEPIRKCLRLAARGASSFGALVSCNNTFLLRCPDNGSERLLDYRAMSRYRVQFSFDQIVRTDMRGG